MDLVAASTQTTSNFIWPSTDPNIKQDLLSFNIALLRFFTGWKKNNLVCNTSKTDVTHFTSKFTNNQPLDNVSLGSCDIDVVTSVRNLGVTLDNHLQMTPHIDNLCKSASFSLKRISQIRRYLDRSTAERLVHAFVSSWLDQCNSRLYGLPDTDISKLH